MRDINSLNKVILVGHLGRKPEFKVIPQSQRPVANFTMATSERFFNPNTRESRDDTQWHRIVVWGKLAEFCERYLDKGKQILLEGKLRTRDWQDRDGNKRTTTEIVAYNIVLLGKREGHGTGTETSEPETRDFGGAPDDFPQDNESGSDDDIPF